MSKPIKIFLCYAHEDETLRRGLEKQLRSLRRQGGVDVWHDRQIEARAVWVQAIDQHLNSAQIILLLISPAPFAIGYMFEGKLHNYLPDAVGMFSNGTFFISEAGMEDDKRKTRTSNTDQRWARCETNWEVVRGESP